jgi:hypothetical protein
MEIGKGSKPVVYNSNIRMQYYGTNLEDSCVELDNIYPKVVSKGNVVVFGQITVYLLFSYIDAKKEKKFIAESKKLLFSELVTCHISESANLEFAEAKVSFNPIISCRQTSGSGYTWEYQVEGEFDVNIIGNELPSNTNSEENFIDSTESTTVMQLGHLGLPANEILEMDSDSLTTLIRSSSDSHHDQPNTFPSIQPNKKN